MYTFHEAKIANNLPDFCRLTSEHYQEMKERLEKDGIKTSPFNPQLDRYIKFNNDGWLKFFIVKHDAECVGYCLIYITNDMHNGDKIAKEDALFVTRNHRNGIGKKLVQHVLAELKKLDVQKAYCTAVTDLRVSKLWQRMGFKNMATEMVYELR
ncbi:MAG: GNAT family N-acetyltransferase [Microcystis sp. M048S1]|jgi:N-acetylglutamate synthase-like GNAT family acetyltransferase|uniref:GNAT family N-acetyltransferase n=1 Tax=Microcystis sp. M048S1 TaxID=2771119 RepID=UPI0025876A5E|nr:GNAT family N-acetyltransferase [Microcystis sp. M048S1]MCA2891406.1 GNAT family N-acetyltransferase [Microcystis sp. M048S1]